MMSKGPWTNLAPLWQTAGRTLVSPTHFKSLPQERWEFMLLEVDDDESLAGE